MSDQAEDQGATTDTVAEAGEPGAVTGEPEPVAEAGEPGAVAEAGEPEPVAEADAAGPGPDTARYRRPSSLRAAATAASNIPRRKLDPPTFPGSPAFPGSSVQPPVSESAEQEESGQVRNTGPSLRERLPIDRLSRDGLPVDKLPVDKLRTLIKQRPEVGLGVAFAGGLVIATILKRLGRR